MSDVMYWLTLTIQHLSIKWIHYYNIFTFTFTVRSVTECEKPPRRPASWPGSCTPRWCAPALRRLRSSGPSACLPCAPGSGRRWRGGSTAPCTEGSRLAGLEQNPLAMLALETLLHYLKLPLRTLSLILHFIFRTLQRCRTCRVTGNPLQVELTHQWEPYSPTLHRWDGQQILKRVRSLKLNQTGRRVCHKGLNSKQIIIRYTPSSTVIT